MKQLLARGEMERDSTDIERVDGLGNAPSKRHDHISRQSLIEKDRLSNQNEGELARMAAAVPSDANDSDEGKARKKARKKEKKREKKERKKEKKKEKKRKREGSSSDDDRR